MRCGKLGDDHMNAGNHFYRGFTLREGVSLSDWTWDINYYRLISFLAASDFRPEECRNKLNQHPELPNYRRLSSGNLHFHNEMIREHVAACPACRRR